MKSGEDLPSVTGKGTEEVFLTIVDVAALNAGADSFKAGRVKPWEEVKASLRAKREEVKRNSLHIG